MLNVCWSNLDRVFLQVDCANSDNNNDNDKGNDGKKIVSW